MFNEFFNKKLLYKIDDKAYCGDWKCYNIDEYSLQKN